MQQISGVFFKTKNKNVQNLNSVYCYGIWHVDYSIHFKVYIGPMYCTQFRKIITAYHLAMEAIQYKNMIYVINHSLFWMCLSAMLLYM